MRRVLVVVTFVLALVPGSVPAAPGISADEAREAAARFGQALRSGDASGLRPILPAEGKVQLSLTRLGTERGFFAASQVEALFREFLAEAEVRSFDVLRLECDAGSSARVHGRAVLVDRQGRPWRVGIHLALQPEDTRWVLREIKETTE